MLRQPAGEVLALVVVVQPVFVVQPVLVVPVAVAMGDLGCRKSAEEPEAGSGFAEAVPVARFPVEE